MLLTKDGIDYEVYMVSRNGYSITHRGLEEHLPNLFNGLLDQTIKNFPDKDLIVLDGELLPWSALGTGLIEKTYKTFLNGMSVELPILELMSSKLGLLIKEMEESGYKTDRHLPKKERISKYGHHKYNSYEGAILLSLRLPSVEEYKSAIEVFRKQLDNFCAEVDQLVYKPFQVLKLGVDGREEVLPFNNEEGYKLLNDTEYITINLDDEDALDKAKAFMQSNVEQGYEGVVVKPINTSLEACPYIKVRGEDYLTLVYGPLYKRFYSTFVRTKKVRSKFNSAIKQWNLSLSMLEVPYSEIPESSDLRSLLIKFIGEERKVEALDPRL